MNFFNFYDSTSFLDELKHIEEKTHRSFNVIRSLRLLPTKEDTLEAKLGTRVLPIDDFALTSLEDRAMVTGQALKALSCKQYARVINTCLRAVGSKEKSTIVTYDGKILAFLSNDYKILPVDKMFSIADKVISEKGGAFSVGFADPYKVEARYILPESICDSYRDVVPNNYVPTVSIQTSNVGLSGANIFPQLTFRGNQVPVGAPMCLQHKGVATIEKFEENIKNIYSLFFKSFKQLSELKKIKIQYPVGTMISVCKKNHIPKKYVAYAAEYFKDLIDVDDEITAYDVYFAITEVIFIAETEGKSNDRLFSLKENVARCLNTNWADFDLPTVI